MHRYGERPAAARRAGRRLRRLRDPARRPRRAAVPAPGEAREYLAEVRERTIDVIDRPRRRRRHRRRAGPPPRAAAQRDDAADASARPAGRLRPASAATCRDRDQRPGAHRARAGARSRAGRARSARRRRGFAYDNERPRHRTDVRGYLIGRTPITNATYLTFVEGGGYERREWWSDEGWSWKEDYDITTTAGLDGRPPVGVAPARSSSHCTRTDRSSTSPGSRPTPSPVRTVLASPPKPSGRRRRPGIRSRQTALALSVG